MVFVDEDRCTGCGLCMEACPTGAISVTDGVARIEQALCRECEVCLSTCPTGAISAVREPIGTERPTGVPAPTPAPVRPVARVPQLSGSPRPWLDGALAYIRWEVVPQVAAFLRNRGQKPWPMSLHHAPTAPGRGNRGGWGSGRRARRRRRGRW
jgi:NAD-dependent dihydropyrimidine dehydrogenase PreA subunit